MSSDSSESQPKDEKVCWACSDSTRCCLNVQRHCALVASSRFRWGWGGGAALGEVGTLDAGAAGASWGKLA